MSAVRRAGSWLAVSLLAAAAYAPLLPWLVARWTAPDLYFSHGPLVPFACGWLVWQRRAALRDAAARGDWRGLAIVLPALLLLCGASALRIDSVAAASIVPLLPGLVLLLEGARAARVLALPLSFLAFAIPWPMILVLDVLLALKWIVVGGSTALVNLFGAGLVAEGSWLRLPDGGRLLVGDECSGLNSALALLALGTFIACSARELPARRRALLVALALPVAVIANMARVTLLAAVGRLAGPPAVDSWHTASAVMVYALAIATYVGLERRLRPRPAAETAP